MTPSCKGFHRLWAALAVVLAMLAPSIAHAQRYLGAISGTVSDPSGAKVAGAQVTATEASTHFVTTVETTSVGAFNMPALQPGTYTLTVSAQGFKKETRTAIVLTAGQTQI